MTDSESASKQEKSGVSKLPRSTREARPRPNAASGRLDNPPPSNSAEAAKGIAKLFQNREKPYTPVNQSLEAIGLKPKHLKVEIDGETVECFVIPVQELVYREWKHMTKYEIPESEVEKGEQ